MIPAALRQATIPPISVMMAIACTLPGRSPARPRRRLYQARNRRGAAVHDADGPAVARLVLQIEVDAQDRTDRRHEIDRAHRALGDGGRLGVGAADDLSAADAAAGQYRAPGARV